MSLKLNGATSGTATLDAPAVAGTTQFYFPTVGGTLMVQDPSGNLGIGTTSPSASISITKQSTTLSGTSNSYGLYLYPTSSGLAYVDAVTSGAGNTSLGFRTYNNGSYNDALRIDASGNVGIGTASGITTVSSGLAINNATATNYPGLEIQTAGVTRMYLNANNAASYISSVGTSPLSIYTNSAERFRFGSAGQLGIGGANYGTAGQALISGGTSAAPTWGTITGGFTTTAVITATGNWTVPTGITAAKVTLIGAGGAGGGTGINNGNRGLAGRSGGVAIKYITGLTPGSTVSVTIGAGGTGVSNGNGNSGGTTSFGAYCSATGGAGGAVNTSSTTFLGPYSGGTGSSGDINITGPATMDVLVSVGLTTTCAGTISGTSSQYQMPGANGWNSFGVGGAPRITSGGAGNAATGYGAGGGGAWSTSTAQAGGNGAPGLCIIEY
jgi:hypothetical protein